MRCQVCLLLSPLRPWNLPSKGLVPFVGVGRKHQTLGPGCPLFTGIHSVDTSHPHTGECLAVCLSVCTLAFTTILTP